MNKERHITSFYMETLLLIAVFIAIILVLTQVFGLGRTESSDAKLLTNAVTLAQNAAEAFSASDSPQRLAALLDENGNTVVNGVTVEARYGTDMTPDPTGKLVISSTWEPAVRGGGTLVTGWIAARYEGRDEPIYEMKTAVYLSEVTE